MARFTGLLIAALTACAVAFAVAAGATVRDHGWDRSYGTEGVVKVTRPFPQRPYSVFEVNGFTAAADGDAFVFGRGNNGYCSQDDCEPEQVMRFNHAGRRDGTYGGQGALILPARGTGYTMFADHAARLVVGSFAKGRVLVRRFGFGGRPDPTFGKGGSVSLPCGCEVYESQLRLFEIGDGKILVDANRGLERNGNYHVPTRVRLTELRRDGSLERGFGRDGSVSFEIRKPGQLTAVAPAHDGSILLGGGVVRGHLHGPIYLWRVTPDGRVDKGFVERAARAVRGSAALGDLPELTAIVPEADGDIAALGTNDEQSGFYLRLRADGSRETGFARHGVKPLPFAVISAVGGLHGAVFAVGWGHDGYHYRAFRIFPGGRLDPRYHGAKGRAVPLPGAGVHVFSQGSGRVLIAGKGKNYCRSGCFAEPAMVRFRE